MRSVMVAGVAAVALTLGGCGMFDGKSSSSTSANDQPGTPSTNSTYSGTGSNNAAGAANRTAATMSPSAEQSGTSAARHSSSRMGAGSADVREAQQELQSAGFYKGKIDGIDGRQTRQALMSFQKKNGLPQTGNLDKATMAQLQSGSSSSGSGSSTSGASAPSKGSNSSGAATKPQQ
jgi:peptidoglycan hydrolase-like protein with peptidoglycan-binding domain